MARCVADLGRRAPPVQVPVGGEKKPVRMQFVIDSQRWGRIGQSWSEFWRIQSGAVARSTTLLTAGPFGKRVRVDSSLGFDARDQLDELKVWVHGLPAPVEIEAASYGQDFPCIITIGKQRHEFALRQDMASAFAEVFRPFVFLKGLRVGQTWRIASINPLGCLWGEDPTPEPIVARVTRRETVDYMGRKTECFRVETKGAVAWVDDQGRVLLQQVDLPVLGKVSIRLLERFDEAGLRRAKDDSAEK